MTELQALTNIAQKCINNKWYRLDGSNLNFHYFLPEEINEINNDYDEDVVTSGYCFLDEIETNSNFSGMIRLYYSGGSVKWNFWINENNEIQVEYC